MRCVIAHKTLDSVLVQIVSEKKRKQTNNKRSSSKIWGPSLLSVGSNPQTKPICCHKEPRCVPRACDVSRNWGSDLRDNGRMLGYKDVVSEVNRFIGYQDE